MKNLNGAMNVVRQFLSGDVSEKEAIKAVLGAILEVSSKMNPPTEFEEKACDDCKECPECKPAGSPTKLKELTKTLFNVRDRLADASESLLRESSALAGTLAEICGLNADIEDTLCSGTSSHLAAVAMLRARGEAVNKTIPNLREGAEAQVEEIKDQIVDCLCSKQARIAKVLASLVRSWELYHAQAPFEQFRETVEQLENRTIDLE